MPGQRELELPRGGPRLGLSAPKGRSQPARGYPAPPHKAPLGVGIFTKAVGTALLRSRVCEKVYPAMP
jgi:hypothetical protein